MWLTAHRVRPVPVASTASSRKVVSSVCIRRAACTPKAAQPRPMNPSSAAMNASVRPCTPPRLMMSSRDSGVSSMSPTVDATLPRMNPITAKPAAQARSTPRCSRQASPAGDPRLAAAVAGPGRSGSTPAPRSRRRLIANATAVDAAAKSTSTTKTGQRSPA